MSLLVFIGLLVGSSFTLQEPFKVPVIPVLLMIIPKRTSLYSVICFPLCFCLFLNFNSGGHPPWIPLSLHSFQAGCCPGLVSSRDFLLIFFRSSLPYLGSSLCLIAEHERLSEILSIQLRNLVPRLMKSLINTQANLYSFSCSRLLTVKNQVKILSQEHLTYPEK